VKAKSPTPGVNSSLASIHGRGQPDYHSSICFVSYISIYTIHFAVVFVLIIVAYLYDIVSSLMLTIKIMQMSDILVLEMW